MESREAILKSCPFYNAETGKIDFKYRVLGSAIIIWQIPAPEKIGSFLYMPDQWKPASQEPLGVIVASGPGYYNNLGDFIKNPLNVGDIVVFDKSTPWTIDIYSDKDEKKLNLRQMSFKDVLMLIVEDSDPDGIPFTEIKTKSGGILARGQMI